MPKSNIFGRGRGGGEICEESLGQIGHASRNERDRERARESQKEHYDAIVGRCQDVKFCDEGGHRTPKKEWGSARNMCGTVGRLVGRVVVSLDRAWAERNKKSA